MKVIPNLKYTDKHEWVKIDGEFAYIGITAYAQNQLGEVLFVEMPEVGDELNQGEEYGVVESSKVASEEHIAILVSLPSDNEAWSSSKKKESFLASTSPALNEDPFLTLGDKVLVFFR